MADNVIRKSSSKEAKEMACISIGEKLSFQSIENVKNIGSKVQYSVIDKQQDQKPQPPPSRPPPTVPQQQLLQKEKQEPNQREEENKEQQHEQTQFSSHCHEEEDKNESPEELTPIGNPKETSNPISNTSFSKEKRTSSPLPQPSHTSERDHSLKDLFRNGIQSTQRLFDRLHWRLRFAFWNLEGV